MASRHDIPGELIAGGTDEGYGAVADAFARNFTDGKEVGAACCVYRDGRKVVDLWGGYRDGHRRLPWRHDTIVTVMSMTKGLAAMTVALAHTRGLVDFDEAVASYWPEFAVNGKGAITVAQLLSHQAGLPALAGPVDPGVLGDPDALASILASQTPRWPPGSRHGYHAITLGFYEAEVIRRVDPRQRTLSRFFAEEIAAPLGLEFHIGLPDHVADERRAVLHTPKLRDALLHLHAMPWRYVLALLNPRSLTRKALAIPGIPVMTDPDIVNRREFLAPELPAVNGTGLVRSAARAYGSLATGGHELGLAATTLQALQAPREPPPGGVRDAVLHFDTAYSLGYVRPTPAFWFGAGAGRAFGMPGGGGSMGFADPETGVGYGYAPNRIGIGLPPDPREVAIRRALYDALGASVPQT